MNGDDKKYLEKYFNSLIDRIEERLSTIEKKLDKTINNTTKNETNISNMKWVFGTLWVLILVLGAVAQAPVMRWLILRQ